MYCGVWRFIKYSCKRNVELDALGLAKGDRSVEGMGGLEKGRCSFSFACCELKLRP